MATTLLIFIQSNQIMIYKQRKYRHYSKASTYYNYNYLYKYYIYNINILLNSEFES